jgi:putative endonuclease
VGERKERFSVYVLKSSVVDTYYIGVTADLEDRIRRHNEGRSRATKAYRPWEIAYTEEYSSRSQALARERQLKAWKNKERIRQLINRV